MSPSGRRALVTGASSGIGAGVAARLRGAGAEVFITGFEDDLVPAEAERIGAAGFAVCDFSRPGEAARAAAEAVAVLGTVDVLVSNTGGPQAGTFLELAEEEWERSYRLMLDAAIQLTRGVLPGMVGQRWGRLVYLTSSGVVRPLPQLHLSNVMRAGVEALAHSLTSEVGPDGVNVHVIAPAHIDTARRSELAQMRARKEAVELEEVDARDLATIAVGRFGRPRDIAELVAFLCGEQAGYLTGQTYVVDGGSLYAGAPLAGGRTTTNERGS